MGQKSVAGQVRPFLSQETEEFASLSFAFCQKGLGTHLEPLPPRVEEKAGGWAELAMCGNNVWYKCILSNKGFPLLCHKLSTFVHSYLFIGVKLEHRQNPCYDVTCTK